jgi:putative two-component system hydrogenase maturation factor HypX/HoxX
VGRHRAAGECRDGRRRHLGDADLPHARGRKSSLYRNEVTEAATAAVLEAVEKFEQGGFTPTPLDYANSAVRGSERPLMKQDDRRIDWSRDDTATVLRKLRAADSFPGLADRIAGVDCWLFNAHAEGTLRGAQPGAIIAQRQGALCRATVDGAVWLTHAKRKSDQPTFKLPAAQALPEAAKDVPESALPALPMRDASTWQDIVTKRRAASASCTSISTTAPCRPRTACACATPSSRLRSARRRSSC